MAKATADDFLGHLVDSVDSLNTVTRRDPLDVPTAVATAKRQLAGAYVAIDLHDRLRTEMERVASSEPLTTSDFSATSPEEHGRRLRQLEADSELLLALVATAAYWGDQSTDGWWFDDIARFGARPIASGNTALIDLVQLPATAILYAAGIAAAGARRFDLLVRLLTEPTTTNNRDHRVSVATHLTLNSVWHDPRSHRRLHYLLRSTFESHLGLGEAAYRDASERFEYLRLTQATFERQQRDNLLQDIVSFDQRMSRIREALALPRNVRRRLMHVNPDGSEEEIEVSEKALNDFGQAFQEARQRLSDHARVSFNIPHIRAVGGLDRGYIPAPAEGLQPDILRVGAEHPLVRAGLCGGNVDYLRWSMAAVDAAFNRFADDAAVSALPPGGGWYPSVPFYPDEIGKWAKAQSG